MIYLLQVSTCWIICYAIYALFLQKETFFSINRYYLLGSLIAGLTIPYIGGFLPANTASSEVYTAMYAASALVEVTATPEKALSFSWVHALWLIYGLGASLVTARITYGLWRIRKLYTNGIKEQKLNHILINTQAVHLPFSFFHYVFISNKVKLKADMDHIIRHEQLHVSQWHSLDVLLTEVLQVFFWFNPIIPLYKKALRQSHEYLADAYVTSDSEKHSYGQLLLGQSTSGMEIALANQFFNSQIKKRIKMMYTEKSSKSAMVKYLAVVPVLAVLLFMFSCNMNKSEVPETNVKSGMMSPLIGQEGDSNSISHEKSFAVSDLNENKTFDFPKDAKIILKTATSILQEDKDYTVNRDKGTVTLLGTLKESDLITVQFLGEDIAYSESEPLIVVNGDVKGKGNHIAENINPDDIATMNIYKGEEAIKKYGQVGKDGVIEIVLKANRTFDHSSNDEILKVCEEMPRFPGCEDIVDQAERENCAKQKMLTYIYTNIKYPKEARDANIDGMVVIQMTIGKDGEVRDTEIVRNVEGGCGDEALRVVNSLPKFIPGKQRGKLVNVKYTLPVRFKLEGEKAEELDDEEIYKVVPEMPMFPGCEDVNDKEERHQCAKQKMLEYIYKNVTYPAEARDNGTEGVSVIGFIVTKTGAIKDAKILRNPGDGTGEESLRVVNTMPNFIPGKIEGDKAVNVSYVLPVKYKLADDSAEKEASDDTRKLEIKGPVASPNPSNGSFRLQFQTQSTAPIGVNIYNEAGETIKKLNYKTNSIDEQIDITDHQVKIAIISIVQEGKEKIIVN